MNESTVKEAMRRELRRLFAGQRFVERKIHGSAFQSGLPDHLVIALARTSWVETKDIGGQLSALQRVEFAKMEKAGAVIFVGDDGAGLARAVALYHLTGESPMRWPGAEIRTDKKKPATCRKPRAEREGAQSW
jgi:hypothetical protein